MVHLFINKITTFHNTELSLQWQESYILICIGVDYMNCKITRNAAKVIQKELEKEENKDLKLRVTITHSHGDHAHYGMNMDKLTDNDELIMTDKEIEVIMAKDQPLLDGVKIDYLYFPKEGFVITNPSKGNSGDH
jgi:Fe-S cluster assembly iron-binding protein IscA